MQERHKQREIYFQEQSFTSKNYVIPFIQEVLHLNENTEVLEIGCGEGGNLKPFLDLGCNVTGVDILESKIQNAKKFFSSHPNKLKINLVASDIYQPHPLLDKKFDLIIMRDVLEHIHDQNKFMSYVKKFLKPESKFFLGFPPWQNPFGGHQQMCYNSFLNKLPWLHLLPGKSYPFVLKIFKEPESRIEDLLEIRDTRITIEKFRKILKKKNYKVDKEVFWFINPNYKAKFGLRPRIMCKFISKIPYIRNFFITTNYYIIHI